MVTAETFSTPPLAATRQVSELERLRMALRIDGALVYEWHLGDDRIQWDEKALSILGVKDAATVASGHLFGTWLDTDGAALRENLRKNPSADFSSFHLEYQFRTSAKDVCWVEDRGRRLFDENNVPVRIVGVLRVITERKMHEAQINYLASYDELTGHLNRARLKEQLDQTLNYVRRFDGKACYILAGIDDLAIINADYGFDVADEVIVGVGDRLKGGMEAGDVIGRTAGNKFGIILNDCTVLEMPDRTRKLMDEVRQPAIETSAGSVPVSISVGCVAIAAEEDDAQKVMIQAEEALDSAKRSGRSKVEIFSRSEKTESTRKRNALLADQVVSALNDRRIVLAYQPIVSAETFQVHKYECLIRLRRPEGELIPAGAFIPAAEELGLVRLLDRRVLELAIETLHQQPSVKLAVNVSGMTATEALCLEGYLDFLGANLGVTERLTVELTETSAIRDMEESVRFLSRLRNMGCSVAIDDFGAGYTSFRNLQALVVDSVKIDGAFIRDLEISQDNQLFVRTLVDLAKNFELETVAEWVGTAREAELLRQYGVDYLQGFYVGKPELDLLDEDVVRPVPAAISAA